MVCAIIDSHASVVSIVNGMGRKSIESKVDAPSATGHIAQNIGTRCQGFFFFNNASAVRHEWFLLISIQHQTDICEFYISSIVQDPSNRVEEARVVCRSR